VYGCPVDAPVGVVVIAIGASAPCCSKIYLLERFRPLHDYCFRLQPPHF